MIILGITDIHGAVDKLEKIFHEIEQADWVLLVGDVTNFGHEQDILNIVKTVNRINSQILAVPGNCDFPETDNVLNEININLNGKHKIIDQKVFLGLGASLPTPHKGTPFEVSEKHLGQNLEKAMANTPNGIPKILISHQPPYGTIVDKITSGMHVGSKEVRRFIEQYQPMICFTGHIHEGIGIDTIGETTIINPGPMYKGNYAYADIGETIQTLEIRNIN